MKEQPVTVSRVAWRDLCPPLLIFRSLPTAAGMTVVFLATLGVVATWAGWLLCGLFISQEVRDQSDFGATVELNESPYASLFPASAEFSEAAGGLPGLESRLSGVEMVFQALSRPVADLFYVNIGLPWFSYFLCGGVWTIVVWSFFGCGIARAALLLYTRDESIGVAEAISYARSKFLACLIGVAMPLAGVAFLAIPLAVLGLFMATDIGAAVGGLFWFVAMLISMLMCVLLLGLLFSWPLIICAIAAEGQDSFDGLSRGFAYVFQRPLHYLLYAIIGIVFSALCWLLVTYVVNGVVYTSVWGVSWGANVVVDRTDALAAETGLFPSEPLTSEDSEAVPSTLRFGQRMIGFWGGVLKTLAAGFLYGLFWSIAAAAYLLLRKDLDDTEMDEIFVVGEGRTYELPPLRDDESGIPSVGDADGGQEPPAPTSKDGDSDS